MDKLDLIIERKFQTSNQQIPGKLGNNINGVTNFDLTGEEELLLDDIDNDMLDNSTLSEFNVLENYDIDDLILDTLCEGLDPNKAKQLNKSNKAWGANKKAYNTRESNLKYANASDKKKAKASEKLKRKNGRIDAKVNRINSHNDNASSDKKFGTKYKNARAIDKKYHADMAKNTKGIRKAYHKIKSIGNKQIK